MGQQISMEEAFPTFQKRCTELFDEGMLLRARVDILEQRLAAALEENERLQAGAHVTTTEAAEPEPADGRHM